MAKRIENIRKRADSSWKGRNICGYTLDGKEKENVRFEMVLYNWLETIRPSVKEQTYQRYYDLITNHIVPELGSLPAGDVNSDIINHFSERKLNCGRLDKRGGLSPATVRLLLSIIHSAIGYALEKEQLQSFHGKIQRPPASKRMIAVFSRQEQRQLELFLEDDMDCQKFGILLALHTGIRLGELCGLRWSDINFDVSVLTIQRSIQRVKCTENDAENKTILIAGTPKTENSYRMIPIPVYLKEMICRFYRSRSNEYVVAGGTYPFMDPRTYQYRFCSYLKQCGLSLRNFHVLRHTFATRCMEVGMDVKTLSELLGHSNVNTTLNLYVHSSLENKRRQMNLLQSIRCQQQTEFMPINSTEREKEYLS